MYSRAPLRLSNLRIGLGKRRTGTTSYTVFDFVFITLHIRLNKTPDTSGGGIEGKVMKKVRMVQYPARRFLQIGKRLTLHGEDRILKILTNWQLLQLRRAERVRRDNGAATERMRS